MAVRSGREREIEEGPRHHRRSAASEARGRECFANRALGKYYVRAVWKLSGKPATYLHAKDEATALIARASEHQRKLS